MENFDMLGRTPMRSYSQRANPYHDLPDDGSALSPLGETPIGRRRRPQAQQSAITGAMSGFPEIPHTYPSYSMQQGVFGDTQQNLQQVASAGAPQGIRDPDAPLDIQVNGVPYTFPGTIPPAPPPITYNAPGAAVTPQFNPAQVLRQAFAARSINPAQILQWLQQQYALSGSLG